VVDGGPLLGIENDAFHTACLARGYDTA
jgi:hypothetical protein